MLDIGRWTLLVYPFLMLLGGVLGYASKRSVPSLIAGAGSAVVLLATYALTRSHPRAGLWIGAVVGAAMFVSLWMRYQKSGAFYPAGLFGVVSVVAVLVFLVAALQRGE